MRDVLVGIQNDFLLKYVNDFKTDFRFLITRLKLTKFTGKYQAKEFMK